MAPLVAFTMTSRERGTEVAYVRGPFRLISVNSSYVGDDLHLPHSEEGLRT